MSWLASKSRRSQSSTERCVMHLPSLLLEAKHDALRKEHYFLTSNPARSGFHHAADEIFFEHLWARCEAQEKSVESPVRSRAICSLTFRCQLGSTAPYDRASFLFGGSRRPPA